MEKNKEPIHPYRQNEINNFMNKSQKITISIYVSACFLIFLAFLLWYFKFTQLMLNALLWGKITKDYSSMDFFLKKMLFSDVLSWMILAIPTFFLYKHRADKK
jgi:hypothetical protein